MSDNKLTIYESELNLYKAKIAKLEKELDWVGLAISRDVYNKAVRKGIEEMLEDLYITEDVFNYVYVHDVIEYKNNLGKG